MDNIDYKPAIMEVLKYISKKCTEKDMQLLFKFIENKRFPLHLNFHFVKRDIYFTRDKNYYVTFKFTVMDNGQLHVDYNSKYYLKIIHLYDKLELVKLSIYQPWIMEDTYDDNPLTKEEEEEIIEHILMTKEKREKEERDRKKRDED